MSGRRSGMIIQVRRLSAVMLGIAVSFLIAALSTRGWKCGYMFTECKSDRGMIQLVLSLLLIGLILISVIFVMDLIAFCSNLAAGERRFIVARLIMLYIGTATLLAAILLYTIHFNTEWSYFMAICGTIIATQASIATLMTSKCTGDEYAY
ncbi:unnamed protein product [Calicophoron daubneyi]|uniref:Uncharacterized protein n=2 Tax=Calicophoron daubneyi TaxID=300641 RepID=A0AAV2T9W7_CALDB